MEETRSLAPVILFTYNRPEHTKRTIEALAANELAAETDLYVFSDAAKKDRAKNMVIFRVFRPKLLSSHEKFQFFANNY